MPVESMSLNSPLRARSAPTTLVTLGGYACSPANGTIAIGIIVAPPPMISMVSCARATKATRQRANSQKRDEKIMSFRGLRMKVHRPQQQAMVRSRRGLEL